MFKSLITLTLAASGLIRAQDTVASVMPALQEAKIVPNIIPNFTPRFPLDVRFTANGTVFPVTAGANLTKSQTANIPSFAIVSNNTMIIGKPYLMAIIDPDALTPQNPNISQIRHFLGQDYISNRSTDGEFILTNHSKTALLSDFVAPGPPPTSDPHRYIVLCYLQNHTGITPPSNFNASDLTHFNITNFVENVRGNNLTLVAATFFWVSANDTTGSVKGIPANGTNGGTLPSGTAPAPSGSQSGGSGSGAIPTLNLSASVGWSVVGILAASGALLL